MKAIGLTYPLEIRDADLSGRILATLAADGQVKTDDLQVFVEDGAVTLLGTVDTPYERDRATVLTRWVPGVRTVDNRLTVAVEQYLDDDDLLARIQDALLRHPVIARYRLGARIKRGVVTLLGRVNTLSEARAAIVAAERVKGVRQVVSAIKVGEIEPTKEPVGIVDDAALLGLVSAALADAGVTIFDNQSTVRNGLVHLRGRVPDRLTLWRALAAVQRVPGLQSVRNELVLQTDATSSNPDEALAGRVFDALQADGRVSPAQVMPHVAQGVVTLTGEVDSIEDHDAALEIASRVPGVRAVVDQIRILGRQPLRATDRQSWVWLGHRHRPARQRR